MKLFFFALVLAVLAAVAIRVWFIGEDEAPNTTDSHFFSGNDEGDDSPRIMGRLFQENSPEPTKETSAINATTPEQPNDVQLVTVSNNEDSELREILEAAGYDAEQFIADTESWFHKRGMRMDFIGFPSNADPMQPYEQYDEATLISFAETGDMWAQQRLGERWLGSRPADAIAMLKLAADQGSIKAMNYIGMIYSGNFGLRDPTQFSSDKKISQAEAVIAATPDLDLESARWMGAAQIVSGGMFAGPDNGSFTGDPGINQHISPERQREFCDAALQGYEDLRDRRATAGLPPLEITANPLWGAGRDVSFCDSPDWPRPDTSHCREIQVLHPDRSSPYLMSLCPLRE